jgi:hypothetical protein
MDNNLKTYNSGSELQLSKKLYDKSAYLNTINNQFTELVPSTPEGVSVPTTEEFFELYNELFYEIPKEGEINSHEYLIKQSTDYIGSQVITEDIQALLDEITSLREENLTLQQNIVDLTLPTNDNNNTTK